MCTGYGTKWPVTAYQNLMAASVSVVGVGMFAIALAFTLDIINALTEAEDRFRQKIGMPMSSV